MLSKNEVKYIQSLYHKKTRNDSDFFIAEGEKIVSELLASNYEIIKIYAQPEWIINNTTIKNVNAVSEDELKRISRLTTPNNVIAIGKKKTLQLPDNTDSKLCLVLDSIQNPGNLGTIIRIADWFGITNIVAGNNTADLYNYKVIQSTMGSFTRMHFYYTDLKEFLQKANVPVLGALLYGTNVYEVGKVEKGLLVIGNESKGINEELLPFITEAITIPRIGKAQSLNAAVAAGIILSHII